MGNTAREKQVGGNHYTQFTIQPMEYAMANDFNYYQTLVLRYITRYKDKGGIIDLEKAKHSIDLLIEYERSQEFQKKQFQALVKSVDSESIKHRDSLIEREIAPFGDWKTMDGDRRGAVANWISERVGRMLTADTGFMGRWNRLVQNGDREGLAKLERDKLSEVVPRLVPMAAKVFGVSKAAGKPQPKPAQAGQPAAKPAPGIQMVKGPPSIDKVDREATKRLGLAFNNQAKLKNGQIVQWT